MEFKEIKDKKVEELNQLEAKLRKELADLGLKARMGQSAETAKIGAARRDIARVLTAKRMKTGEQGKGQKS
jgi:ribosomal protein L29